MSYMEHDIVSTSFDLVREGHYILEDEVGTIVSVASEKDGAYVVEFDDHPSHPVVLCYDSEFILVD
jgi:hypothetical protein